MNEADDERLMRAAVEKTREGIKKGQTPFGACISKDGMVVSCRHNTVWRGTDITAHAEINAIRDACRKLKTIDLSSCVIYSTCEPCPMCYSAIHWARISKIAYGCGIKDAQDAGFNELGIPAKKMKSLSKDKTRVVGGLLKDECRKLFAEWKKNKRRRPY